MFNMTYTFGISLQYMKAEVGKK